MAPKFLTVTALTYALKRLIEENVSLADVWIKGEISNFTSHSSGHLYFTLKDDNSRLSCVMFKTQARTLKFIPENGQAVSVTGRLSVYEKLGNYQLYIDQMESDGLGNLYQAFEKLKQKLDQEGLFDPNRKRSLPPMPQKIGIITSPTGAAIQDMIKVLRRRRPNLDILIFPALVQGDEAPKSLIKALNDAVRFRGLDLLIIGRGGGSLEDLWAFNDEQLARAISGFPRPVISAVGHETDFTIADFVADLRAPTPSAAAELAVPDQQSYQRNLNLLTTRLKLATQRKLQNDRKVLNKLLANRIFTSPQQLVNPRRQDLDLLTEQLLRLNKQRLLLARERFARLIGKLDTLSPLATLQRGYAIAYRQDGTLVRHIDQVEIGDPIRVQLAVGKLDCEIKHKEN